MSLIATHKIADYINNHPESRVALLTWLKEYPYREGQSFFANREGVAPTGAGGGESSPGTGEYCIRYRINYTARSVYITWVGSKEEREQELEREINEIRQKHPNETFITKTVTLTVPAPEDDSQLLQANEATGAIISTGSFIDPPWSLVESQTIPLLEIGSLFTTEAQYLAALAKAAELFNNQPGTPDFDELSVLLPLIQHYEEQVLKFPTLQVWEIIGDRMNMLNLPASYLASKVGGEDKFNNFLNGNIILPPGDLKKLYQTLGLCLPVSDQRFY